jgi:Tir chaperone protein (CesT) family
MEYRDLAQQLLNEIGQRAGVSLRLTNEDSLALSYDQNSRLFLQIIDHAILFSAPLELSVSSEKETVWRDILQLNFLNRQTDGCTLGLDPADSSVWVSYILPLDNLGADELENACVNFMTTADRLKERVRSLAEATSPALVPAVPDMYLHQLRP